MPLDVLCPSCRSSFPVTNAGPEFHVECPACDAGIGVSVAHPDAGKIGSVPQASARLADAPAAKRVPATVPKAHNLDDEDDDKPKRGKGGSSAWVVIIGSTVGLLVVLAGVGATGYFLFTNLDTDDPPPARGATTSPNKTVVPNAPRPGGIAPRPGTPTQPNPTPTFTPPNPITPSRPNVPSPKISATPKATGFVVPPAPVTPVEITPMPAGGQETYTITLPGRVDQARVGGGGRYLVLTFQNPRKMVVYDLTSGKSVAERPLDAGPTIFAVGMNKLVMMNPFQKALAVFKFPELQPDGEARFSLQRSPPSGIAMGSATNGPVFVAGANEVGLIDLEARAVIDGSLKDATGPVMTASAELRASHDGKLFTATFGGWVTTYKVENGKWAEARVSANPPPLAGANGDVLYGGGQLFAPDGRPVGPNAGAPGHRVALLPATHGPQFLRISEALGGPPRQGPTLTVHTGREPVIPTNTLGEYAELSGPLPLLSGPTMSNLDRHLFFVPDAKVLAVIPFSKDKLILRRLKLD